MRASVSDNVRLVSQMLSASLFSVLYSAFFQSGPKERLKSRTQVGKVRQYCSGVSKNIFV